MLKAMKNPKPGQCRYCGGSIVGGKATVCAFCDDWRKNGHRYLRAIFGTKRG